ncbi:uncharacterized protein LOC144130118 isoform X2 [Amblyomma americanum]
MSAFSSEEALPANVLEERAKIMQNSGVHIVFPNGRLREVRTVAHVNGFSGWTFRVYGQVIDNGRKFYIGLTLNDGAVTTEINGGYPRSYNISTYAHSNAASYRSLSTYLSNNTYFSLALRILKAGGADYYQNYFFDEKIDALAKTHSAFHVYLSDTNSYILLSLHVSNEMGGAFTAPIQEFPNLAYIIPGAFISCVGKYIGSDTRLLDSSITQHSK